MISITVSSRKKSLPLEVWYMIADILYRHRTGPIEEFDPKRHEWWRYWRRDVLDERFPPYIDNLIPLSNTCSWFRDLLAPRLFAMVILTNTTKSALSIEAISKGKWSSCVKELRYIGIGYRVHTIEEVYPPELDRVLSNLACFRHLQSITIEFPFDYQEIEDDFQETFDADPANALIAENKYGWRGLMVASYRAIVSNYASCPRALPADQLPWSLTIDNLTLDTVSLFTTQAFQDFLSHFKTFNLSLKEWDNGAGCNLNTQEIFFNFPDQLGPWFFNHLSSVEEFTFDARYSSRLGGGGDVWLTHDISLRNATMPHLRTVTLQHIIICTELRDFLTRNIKTLESIKLENCFSLFGRIHQGDDYPNCLRWCTLFTALARKNPRHLRSFELICEADKDHMLDLDFTYNEPVYDPDPNTLAQARKKFNTEPEAIVFPYGYIDDKYGFGYRSHIDNQIEFVAGDDERAWYKLLDIMRRNAEGRGQEFSSIVESISPALV